MLSTNFFLKINLENLYEDINIKLRHRAKEISKFAALRLLVKYVTSKFPFNERDLFLLFFVCG